MKVPVSRLKDADMRAVPMALMRAAERARQLAVQTGTPFVVRGPSQTDETPVAMANQTRERDSSV
jgi:hypothetical protein